MNFYDFNYMEQNINLLTYPCTILKENYWNDKGYHTRFKMHLLYNEKDSCDEKSFIGNLRIGKKNSFMTTINMLIKRRRFMLNFLENSQN